MKCSDMKCIGMECTGMKCTGMNRLNSGIKNRHNFFLISIFLVQNVESDSVNLSDSGNIRFLVRFPGNSILKILQNF